jgi:[ribosomal protein S18]-alanine N-acetyltransferase
LLYLRLGKIGGTNIKRIYCIFDKSGSVTKMFSYVPMTKEYAEGIAYNWKYEGEYSLYNMTEDEEDLQEFLNLKTWADSVYAVLDEQEQLIGFFQYNVQKFELEIGLGLKPELTGVGKNFVL